MHRSCRQSSVSLTVMCYPRQSCLVAVLVGLLCLPGAPVQCIDTCGTYPSHDPCRPGGIWDPVLHRCSGYLHGSLCYQCYSGQHCQTRENSTDCTLDSFSGDPVILQEYWLNETLKEPCTSIIAHYRPAYDSEIMEPLKDSIKALHAKVGNAETDGYNLVGGLGATMILHACLITMSRNILNACSSNCPTVVDVLVQTPYYPGYELLTSLVNTTRLNPHADPKSPFTIEIVTNPNNPNGELRTAEVTDSSHVIYDLVYNWPMYTDYLEKFNKEVMIFSSSKHDGLAGSRFGWGLIKNNDLANDTKQVIRSFVLSLSVDAQLRVLTSQDSIMNETVLPSGLLPFHQFGKDAISFHFQQLKEVLSCAELTNYPSKSTGAYAWIKCKQSDCAAFFQQVNLNLLSGEMFGATKQYVRMSMFLPSGEFQVVLEKVKILCSLHS